MLLLDVTPLSLGVETLGGVMTRLIERNTTIPTKKTEVFSTAADSQTSVEIHVLQGEREMARDNRTLGKFQLVGHPARAARRAADRGHLRHRRQRHPERLGQGPRPPARRQDITITASSGLAKDEVEKMVKEAQAHADEDKKRREVVDLRNQADTLAYSLEKLAQGEPRQGRRRPRPRRSRRRWPRPRKAVEGEDAAAPASRRSSALTSAEPQAGGVALQGGGRRRRRRAAPASGPARRRGRQGGDDVVDAEYTVKN